MKDERLRILIYKITNQVNGKIYIGQTKRSLLIRWKEHCDDVQKANREVSKHTYLTKAINKYCKKNFIIQEIDYCNSFDEGNYMESYWINFYRSQDSKIGYNIRSGGSNSPISEKSKHKMSIAKKGKKQSLEAVAECKKACRLTRIKYGPAGVYWCKDRKYWRVRVNKDKECIERCFDSEVEAKETKDKLELYLYCDTAQLFYPSKIDKYLACNLKKFYEEQRMSSMNKKRTDGKIIGLQVTKRKEGYTYIPNTKISGNSFYFGHYYDKTEACLAYDKIMIYLGKENNVNFPSLVSEAYASQGREIVMLFHPQLAATTDEKLKALNLT